jgi:hypothetical protein
MDPDETESTALAVTFSSIEEKEGNSSGFISDNVLTNLLVDVLIIIKKYIKFYYYKFNSNQIIATLFINVFYFL